jgi:mycothiol synthase
MTTPVRLFVWDDIDAVTDLMRACEDADHTGEPVTRESLEEHYRRPGQDPTVNVWVQPAESGRLAAVCGFASMFSSELEAISITVAVHPDHRDSDLDDRMTGLAEEQSLRVRKRPDLPAVWHRGVLATWHDRIAVCERRGYVPERWFLELERSVLTDLPDAPPPTGFELVAATSRDDQLSVYQAITEAFRDHWNPVDFPLELFDHYMSAPSMQPLLPLLARSETREPAGACVVHVLREKNELRGTREGDVAVLGVRRPFRGKGVARALLAGGLRWLRDQGMEVATISVDAQSPTGADRLYASVGFTERRRSVVYAKTAP